MDKTSKLFDVWAKTGRSEEMEKGHGTTVNQFLDKLSLKEKFAPAEPLAAYKNICCPDTCLYCEAAAAISYS